MGEDLSGLSDIRTDRVSRAVPKSRRREGGRERFGSHLKRDDEDEDEKGKPADGKSGDAALPIQRAARRGKLIDYEA